MPSEKSLSSGWPGSVTRSDGTDRELERSEVWPYSRSFPAQVDLTLLPSAHPMYSEGSWIIDYSIISIWWSVCEYWSSRYERNTLLSLIGRRLSRITNLALGGSTEDFFFCVFTNLCKPLYIDSDIFSTDYQCKLQCLQVRYSQCLPVCPGNKL